MGAGKSGQYMLGADGAPALGPAALAPIPTPAPQVPDAGAVYPKGLTKGCTLAAAQAAVQAAVQAAIQARIAPGRMVRCSRGGCSQAASA